MAADSHSNPTEKTDELIARAATGDAEAISRLLERYRERVRRMVALRMDRRLQGRVDASDVVQEAMIEAARRISEYAQQPAMSFYVWLRWLAGEKLLNTHRHHLGTQKRDAGQEVSINRCRMPAADSISLARQLLGQVTSPTRAVIRAELQAIIQDILDNMDPIDRGISRVAAALTLNARLSWAKKVPPQFRSLPWSPSPQPRLDTSSCLELWAA